MLTFLPHAFFFELVQLVLAVCGLVMSCLTLYQCWLDLIALREAKINGRYAAIARRNYLGAWFTVGASVVLSTSAFIFCFVPPPPPFTEPSSIAQNNALVVGEVTVLVLTALILARGVIKHHLRIQARKLKPPLIVERRSGEDRRVR